MNFNYNTMSEMNKSKRLEYYKSMSVIAFPIILQQIISVGLNLIDNLMIGMVSEEAIAAVGAANQVYFIFTTMCYGLYSGAAVYTAQYWGAGNIKKVRSILGIDYLVGTVIAGIFTLSGILFGTKIMWIFDKNPEVISLGNNYLKIVCFSFIFAGISFAINYNSRAIQNLKIPTIINGCALAINTILNYCMIYGNWGFPQMGVKGAAIATLIARIAECGGLLLYIYIFAHAHTFRTGLSELFSFDLKEFLSVMKTALPVVVTEGGWAWSMSAIFSIYGHLGTSALAVTQVSNTVSEFLQSVYFGIGNASAVLIGNELGRGKKGLAFEKANISLRIVYVVNVIIALILIVFRRPFASIYQFSPDTTELLSVVLLAWSLVMVPKMLAYLLVCGILRAGGDTIFSMYMDYIYNLFVQVSLAYIGIYILELPLYFAMLLVSCGDILKIIHCYHRFKSKKWMNVMIERENDYE